MRNGPARWHPCISEIKNLIDSRFRRTQTPIAPSFQVFRSRLAAILPANGELQGPNFPIFVVLTGNSKRVGGNYRPLPIDEGIPGGIGSTLGGVCGFFDLRILLDKFPDLFMSVIGIEGRNDDQSNGRERLDPLVPVFLKFRPSLFYFVLFTEFLAAIIFIVAAVLLSSAFLSVRDGAGCLIRCCAIVVCAWIGFHLIWHVLSLAGA